MNKANWHLDTPFPVDFFDHLWSRDSQNSLLSLFRYVESQDDSPTLATLPEGISPAGLAMAASLYFLAGMRKPPEPHCRIALYPGFHFVRGIKNTPFSPALFYRGTQIARTMMRGETALPPALDKLRRTYKEIDEVKFHWLFKCERVWTQYGNINPQEIIPRGRFGSDDNYKSTIDIIDSEETNTIGLVRGPYDLLIYCPYFHSHSWQDAEQVASKMVSRVQSFKAHRKIILVRSPFEFWSREVERRTKIKGASFHQAKSKVSLKVDLEIKVIDQFINVTDAYTLYDAIENHAYKVGDREIIKELKSVLRFLLVSIDPKKDEPDLLERMNRLAHIRDILKNYLPDQATAIIENILQQVSNPNVETKKDWLLKNNWVAKEIWVTKDRDRASIEELSATMNLKVQVRLMDRWTPAGTRSPGASVVLTRVDREGDLDLVSYLKSGDTLLLSAWELIIKGKSIERSWERSQNWLDRADKDSSHQLERTPIFDPVLKLADYILTAYSNAEASRVVQPVPTESKSETDTWWDEDESNPSTESDLARDELLSDQTDLRACREVKLHGELGIFLPLDREIQVLKNGRSEEFESISVNALEPADMIVLFRDAERSSIFDLVMDQLERSAAHAPNAIRIRSWKRDLLKAFIGSKLGFTGLQSELSKRGVTLNPVTVRSWVTGPTMAPLRVETMQILAEILKIDAVEIESIFNSVRQVRGLARVLGRAINELITLRDPEKLSPDYRKMMEDSEIDLNDLATAIDVREVYAIQPGTTAVPYSSLRKIFKY